MPCRHHLGEVAAQADRFRDAGCGVLVVTQAPPELLRLFLGTNPQPFPVVGDPQREVYRAFGLNRTSWWTFFKPSVVWGYLKMMARGQRVRRPSGVEDVRQLGGDFLLDKAGRIVWSFTSADPTDRPRLEQLFAVLETEPPAP